MALSMPNDFGDAFSTLALPKVQAGTNFYWSDGLLDEFKAWWNTTT